MKRAFKVAVCFMAIGLVLTSAATFAEDVGNRVKEIKAQIHILNLLNGLELREEQKQLILDAAREAQYVRSEAEEIIAKKEEEMAIAYNEVLDVVKNDALLVIPEEIASKVHKIGRTLHETKSTAQEEIVALSMKIRDNLEQYQLHVVANYKPCIIPPVEKGRIGQSDDSSGVDRLLERVRSIPEPKYNRMKETIVRRMVSRARSKTPFGYVMDEEELQEQLLAALDGARAMSDVDFAVEKENIVQNIEKTHAQFLPEKPSANIGVKIARFLLQPEIIPILEERIAAGNDNG